MKVVEFRKNPLADAPRNTQRGKAATEGVLTTDFADQNNSIREIRGPRAGKVAWPAKVPRDNSTKDTKESTEGIADRTPLRLAANSVTFR